jgi:lysozyme family protein
MFRRFAPVIIVPLIGFVIGFVIGFALGFLGATISANNSEREPAKVASQPVVFVEVDRTSAYHEIKQDLKSVKHNIANSVEARMIESGLTMMRQNRLPIGFGVAVVLVSVVGRCYWIEHKGQKRAYEPSFMK